MSNFMEQDFGFCYATDPAVVAAYAQFLSLIERAFLDRDVLQRAKDAVERSDGLDPRDQKALLSRCDYYLWDIDRTSRYDDGVPVTWGLDTDPEEQTPEEKAAVMHAETLDLLGKARIYVDPYVRESGRVRGYWREGGDLLAKVFEVGDLVELDPDYEWRHPEQKLEHFRGGDIGRVTGVREGEYEIDWGLTRSGDPKARVPRIASPEFIRPYDREAGLKALRDYQQEEKLTWPSPELKKRKLYGISPERVETYKEMLAWEQHSKWWDGMALTDPRALWPAKGLPEWNPWWRDRDLSEEENRAQYMQQLDAIESAPYDARDERVQGALLSQRPVGLIMRDGSRLKARIHTVDAENDTVTAVTRREEPNVNELDRKEQTIPLADVKLIVPTHGNTLPIDPSRRMGEIPAGTLVNEWEKQQDGTWVKETAGDPLVADEETFLREMIEDNMKHEARPLRAQSLYFQTWKQREALLARLMTDEERMAKAESAFRPSTNSLWLDPLSDAVPSEMGEKWVRVGDDVVHYKYDRGASGGLGDVTERGRMPFAEFVERTADHWEREQRAEEAKDEMVRELFAHVGEPAADQVGTSDNPGPLYMEQLDRQIRAGKALDVEIALRVSKEMAALADEERPVEARLHALSHAHGAAMQEHADEAVAKLHRVLVDEGLGDAITDIDVGNHVAIDFDGSTLSSDLNALVMNTFENRLYDEGRSPSREERRAARQEAGPVMDKISEAVSELNESASANWVRETHRASKDAQKEVFAVRRKAIVVRRDAYLAALRDVREMGPEGRVFVFEGTSKEARETMDWSTQWFPRDWLRKLRDDTMPLFATFVKKRGRFDSRYQRKTGDVVRRIRLNRRAVSTGDRDGAGVAIHELGHYIELRHPEVSASQWAFWHKRKRDSPEGRNKIRKLADLLPGSGFDDDEVAVEDFYNKSYSGKTYSQGMVGPHFELLTMGVEDIVTGGGTTLAGGRPAWDDPEYRHWLLGLLAGV